MTPEAKESLESMTRMHVKVEEILESVLGDQSAKLDSSLDYEHMIVRADTAWVFGWEAEEKQETVRPNLRELEKCLPCTGSQTDDTTSMGHRFQKKPLRQKKISMTKTISAPVDSDAIDYDRRGTQP